MMPRCIFSHTKKLMISVVSYHTLYREIIMETILIMLTNTIRNIQGTIYALFEIYSITRKIMLENTCVTIEQLLMRS